MSVASQYNLIFGVSSLPGFTPRPFISVNIINGNSVNLEVAIFLEPNGLSFIEHIKSEINSLDYTYVIEKYEIFGHNDSEYLEIRNNPPNQPVAVFRTGKTEVIIPINDFLEILEEWKAFLQTIPNPHWLSGR